MKAMVLAAGEGRRLRPLTDRLPKPMVPLAGRPLLEYTLRWLRRHGIEELVINLHHQPEVIRSHFGDGAALGLRIHYSFERELLGTAGAFKPVTRCFQDGAFLIMYGDNLTNCDLSRLVALHHTKGATATVAVFYRQDVTQSGMVALDGADRITHFVERPQPEEACSHWVSAGIIVAEPALLGYIPPGDFSDLGRDVLPAALAAGEPLYGYRMSESLWWVDSLEEYQSVDRQMRAGGIAL